MNLLATADLHWNKPTSRPTAETLIDQINQRSPDVLLVVGDVGVADGDSIEQCLSRFTFDGPKLFVPGNHELWTLRQGARLLEEELPARIRSAGWHWLPDAPFEIGETAIVGSIGWYDYAFADPALRIPTPFYAAKVSPGAVHYTGEPAELLDEAKACDPSSRDLIARWNDGRFVRLSMGDEQLVEQECVRLESQLAALSGKRSVLVATHTVPFAELLPAHRGGQWDFARAYLGSPRLGNVISRFPNVHHVLCGHSHWPMEAAVGGIRAINIGSGYRSKRVVELTL